MKLKKVLAVTMTAAMTMSMMAGCGSTTSATTEGKKTEASSASEETKAPATDGETKEASEGGSEETEAASESAPAIETATSKKAAEEVAGGKDVTLKTVSMFGGTDPNAIVYQAINKAFMEQHPNVTLEDDSQVSNEEWKSRIAADFSVGNEPDVLQFFVDATANDIISTDKLVPYDEIVKEYPEYAGDTLPDALDKVKNADGVKRAVPTTGYWEGLFCNKDVFEQNGVELPTDWDSFTKAIETFKSKDIIPIACSLNEVPHYWVEFCMLYTAGQDEYVSMPDKAPESWIKGIEVIKTLKEMGAFPEDTDTIDNSSAEQLFNSKKAAMQLDGNWRMNGIDDKDNVVVVPFPGVPDQAKDVAGYMVSGLSSGFYITRKAWDDPDKRDAAVKFVMAQTCKDSLMKYWNGAGIPTCEISEDEMPSDNLAKSGLEYAQAAKGLVLPTDARYNTYKALTSQISGMAAGMVKAEDIINDMITRYKNGEIIE